MYKNRKIYKNIAGHVQKKEYTIITGARQTGKTTLLKHLYGELKGKYNNVFYITLENPDILNEINLHPENVFRFCKRPENPLNKHVSRKDVIYLLIDEIQYSQNPSNFLKYLFDIYQPNLKLIVTGSSAFYMDQKFKDSLAGRKQIFHLKTLSFEEFLEFKNKNEIADELTLIKKQREYISQYKNELLELLNEYLVYGGYPGVVLEKKYENKVLSLQELRNSFVKRDIAESGVDNEAAFYQLMKILSGQIGNLVNVNELSKTLKINNKTIDRYINILRKCFHIELIRPFSGNLRNELIKMPKMYFNDLGLRNSLLNRFHSINTREDKGALLENYLFIRLSELYETENIKFWRTKEENEVDFIVMIDEGKSKAYEVKFSESEFRESKYKKFQTNYPEIKFNVEFYNFDNPKSFILKV
jgi:uncharacterized protein